MPAACLAPLALASRRLGKAADVVRATRDVQRLRLPERESINRPGGPRPTRLAMAVAHRRRLARDGELHRAAEAAPFVRLVVAHVLSFGWRDASMRTRGNGALTGTPHFLTETPWMRSRTS